MTGEVGNIEVNSEEIMSAVSILDQALNILQSDIKPIVMSDFDALKETNLFSEGLERFLLERNSVIIEPTVLANNIVFLLKPLCT